VLISRHIAHSTYKCASCYSYSAEVSLDGSGTPPLSSKEEKKTRPLSSLFFGEGPLVVIPLLRYGVPLLATSGAVGAGSLAVTEQPIWNAVERCWRSIYAESCPVCCGRGGDRSTCHFLHAATCASYCGLRKRCWITYAIRAAGNGNNALPARRQPLVRGGGKGAGAGAGRARPPPPPNQVAL
jgi:hypothetical protein